MTRLNEDSLQGLAYAITAYMLWGFLPLYMKALSHVPPSEVITHRVLWSVPLAMAVLLITGRTADLRKALVSPRILGMAAVTASLIAINWGIYVWLIVTDNALDAALGYYVNPLFSVFLGSALLRERLDRLQLVAVGLAALAVVILLVKAERLPLAALGLTVTWGFYAYFKKSLPIGPNQGFTLEVLILTPPALIFLVHLVTSGQSHFAVGSLADTGLLIGLGVVTATPLMVYANGAKLLRLSTIGILQYIAPTMIFIVAVIVFEERFDQARLIAFPLIWSALIIYSVSLLRQSRMAARNRPPPAV